jgi:lipoprotein-anchoring transpeptidase ErfK/SrfK
MAKKIVIDLTNQDVKAYDGSTLFHSCECVTGDASHATPLGKFKINRKNHPYTSKTYGARLNYAMFFTTTGEALHQYHGPLPWLLLKLGRSITTRVGSHGCVRLQESDAKLLYGWAAIDTIVEIR